MLPAADSEEAAPPQRPRPSEPDPAASRSQSASPRLLEGGRRTWTGGCMWNVWMSRPSASFTEKTSCVRSVCRPRPLLVVSAGAEAAETMQRALGGASERNLDRLITGNKRRRAEDETNPAPATPSSLPGLPAAAWLRSREDEHVEAAGNDNEDEDEWEDAVEAEPSRHADDGDEEEYDEGAASAGFSLGLDVDVTVDAATLGDDANDDDDKDAAPATVAEPTAKETAAEQAELRRLKRKHSADRRQHCEQLHRAGVLCWLAHGRLLSDQADDPMLQSHLLTLLPPSLHASAGRPPTAETVRAIAQNLHARMDAQSAGAGAAAGLARGRGAGRAAAAAAAAGRARGRGRSHVNEGHAGNNDSIGGASSVGGGSGSSNISSSTGLGGDRHASENAWLLVRLIERAARPTPSPCVVAAAPLAQRLLTAPRTCSLPTFAAVGLSVPRVLPVAGQFPFLEPPAARSGRTRAAVEALAARLLEADATASGACTAGPGQAAHSGDVLLEALQRGSASPTQTVLLILAALRTAGLRARLVLALQPPPLKPSPPGKLDATPTEPPADAPHVPLWLEAFLPEPPRWVALDGAQPGRLLLDRPDQIVSSRLLLPKGARARPAHAMAYIVGFSAGTASDVTARYASQLAASKAARTDDTWWDAARAATYADAPALAEETPARALRTPSAASVSFPSAGASTEATRVVIDLDDDNDEPFPAHLATGTATAEAAERADADELRRRECSEPVPSTLAELKKHPLYVLHRDLKASQCIWPPSTPSVGRVKGLAVFPRSALFDLRSEQAWFRRGRDLKPDSEPVKTVKARPGHGAAARDGPRTAAAAAAAAAEGEAPLPPIDSAPSVPDTALYGEWQTAPHAPGCAVRGVVPRSRHGHVELWTAAHLPHGTVHLREPHVMLAARQLGLDAAPAMVGFDVHDGRAVPKIEGAVVCIEHAQLLREASAAIREQAEDQQAHECHEEALALWRQLLRSMAVRERIERQYAHLDDGS